MQRSVVLAALGVAAFWSAACGPAAAQESRPAEPSESRVDVRVDPRVELLSIVFRLAGSPEYQRANHFPYVERVEAWFGPYSAHEVVKTAMRLRRKSGISYDAVAAFAAHLGELPGLEPRVPFEPLPTGLDSRWSPEDAEVFARHLRAFAVESKAVEFFAAETSYHAEVAGRLRAVVVKRDNAAWCDRFFGARPSARFVSVVGLLNGPNNYGPRVVRRDGSEELWQIIGVWNFDAENVPLFPESIVPVYVHEICHSYVNALVDRFAAALGPAGENLYARVGEAMRKQAYGNPKTMLYESLVRASVCRYRMAFDGEPGYADQIDEETANSFLWTKELAAALGRYEGDRKTWPTLEAFMPEVVKVFEEWAKRPADAAAPRALRPINAVILGWANPEEMVLVKPVVEAGKRHRAELETYVAEIHARFFEKKGVPLRTAAEVGAAAKKRALILYGAPRSNALLAEFAPKLGLVFGEDRLEVGGKIFQGPGLALIAAFPNPENREAPVLVYAAAKEKDLVGINGVRHGTTDWLVARKADDGTFAVLGQGRFKRGADGKLKVDP